MAGDDWSALSAALAEQPELRELVQQPGRVEMLALAVGGLRVDLCKQPLDAATLDAAAAISERLCMRRSIEAMFDGEVVNRSEQRAALHTLLRRSRPVTLPALQGLQQQVWQTRQRMRLLVESLRKGEASRLGLAEVRDVVNIGIGGSDLGPRLVAEVLATPVEPLRVHFVSNVDAHGFDRLLQQLDPASTLFVVVSKSFSTQETLLNAELGRAWLQQGGVQDCRRHFVAVSANVDAATGFGVAAEHVYPMWDWVGGRYSIWSAAGISAALAIGMDGFEALLAGAEDVDEHFVGSAWACNLPWLMAWTGVIQRNLLQRAAYAVVPYDQRLRLLPAYLQQLEMESLGKAVQPDGQPVSRATVPVLLPGLGTDAQHAFFQALHQGTEVVPVDFIGVLRPDHPYLQQHQVLLSHMFAQAAALLRGRNLQQALAAIAVSADSTQREAQAAQRVFAGNRPSTTLLLERLDARSLGQLLAVYEHKVYVQSLIWGINAFDQWGVELGKQIAAELLPMLRGQLAPGSEGDLDASTRQLLTQVRAALSGVGSG